MRGMIRSRHPVMKKYRSQAQSLALILAGGVCVLFNDVELFQVSKRKRAGHHFHQVFTEHPKQCWTSHSVLLLSVVEFQRVSRTYQSSIAEPFHSRWNTQIMTEDSVRPRVVRLGFLLWRVKDPQLRNLRYWRKKNQFIGTEVTD